MRCVMSLFAWVYSRTFKRLQNIQEYSKIFSNIPKYSGIFQNIQGYSKVFRDFPKYLGIFKKYAWTFQNIPKHSKIFRRIPKYSNFSKTFQNIPRYYQTFQNGMVQCSTGFGLKVLAWKLSIPRAGRTGPAPKNLKLL